MYAYAYAQLENSAGEIQRLWECEVWNLFEKNRTNEALQYPDNTRSLLRLHKCLENYYSIGEGKMFVFTISLTIQREVKI